jgi:hypothetical protein
MISLLSGSTNPLVPPSLGGTNGLVVVDSWKQPPTQQNQVADVMHVDIVDDCDQDICGILEDSPAGCMGPKQSTWPNIEGVQYIGGPLQVKNWGGPDPCDLYGVDAYAVSPSQMSLL